MKTEQEQIEEMTKLINSKEIYPCEDDVHCENCFCADKDTAEKLYNAGYRKTFTNEIVSDTQKAYKEGYEKAQSELKTEIERLRTTLRQCNTELNSALESLKSQCREIGELKAKVKQTKIDVLTELKKKTYVNDYCREVVEVEKIDELIKEQLKK